MRYGLFAIPPPLPLTPLSTYRAMSSEGYPRRTLALPHSRLFSTPVHTMDHKERAFLSYEKARATGLSYGMLTHCGVVTS